MVRADETEIFRHKWTIGDTPLFPLQPVAKENGNYRTICAKISSAFSRLFSCANMTTLNRVYREKNYLRLVGAYKFVLFDFRA